MSARAPIATLACAAALLAPATAAAGSAGSHEQVAWVRRAASNFVGAELTANGAGACAILYAPLRASSHHRSCAQRWDARLAAMRREPAVRAALHADMRAIGSAKVVVGEYHATIDLPQPLMAGSSSFVWSESCWMLRG